MAILQKKDGKSLQFLKGVASGLTKHGINEASKFADEGGGAINYAYQGVQMLQALTEIANMTDEFFEEFSSNIAAKHEQQIQKTHQLQEEKSKKAEKEKEEVEKRTQQVVMQHTVAPEVEGKIMTISVGVGTRYSSKTAASEESVREYYYGGSSTPSSLSKVFAGNLKSKITGKIQAELVQPVTSGIASWGIEKVSEGFTKDLNEAIAGYRTQREVYNLRSDIAKEKEVDKKKGKEKVDSKPKELSKQEQAKIKAIEADGLGDITDVALLAKTIKKPIAIYKDGELFEIIGRGLPGPPISLVHTPAGVGNWAPLDMSQ